MADILSTLGKKSAEKKQSLSDVLNEFFREGFTHNTLLSPSPKFKEDVKKIPSLLEEGLRPPLGIDPTLDPLNFMSPVGAIRAFHGTPFKFKTFSKAKIGTGEGAQAFGHGLYFTDAKEIAEGYAKRGVFSRGTDPRSLAGDLVEEVGKDKAIKELNRRMTMSAGDNPAFVTRMKTAIKHIENDDFLTPRTYSVTIHKGKTPAQYDYLRWDNDIPDSQLTKIKSFINKNFLNKSFPEIDEGLEITGETLYKRLSAIMGSEKASSTLLDLGIDGIKYPSGTLSGIKGSSKFNFVVFDPNAVTIEAITNR